MYLACDHIVCVRTAQHGARAQLRDLLDFLHQHALNVSAFLLGSIPGQQWSKHAQLIRFYACQVQVASPTHPF